MASGDLERGKNRSSSNNNNNNYSSASYYVETSDQNQWISWLIPMFVVANVAVFIVTMYVNNCPKDWEGDCVARFLGRLSFQPLKQNPLFGPSSSTWVSSSVYLCFAFIIISLTWLFNFCRDLAFWFSMTSLEFWLYRPLSSLLLDFENIVFPWSFRAWIWWISYSLCPCYLSAVNVCSVGLLMLIVRVEIWLKLSCNLVEIVVFHIVDCLMSNVLPFPNSESPFIDLGSILRC